MFKKSLLLMMLFAACFGMARAQSELTVCDGTDSNSNVPFYGLYADTQGAASECVIPSDELEEMTGGQITAMKFYIKTAASAAWTGTHQVYLGEVEATTLTGITGPSAFTVVKTASFDATGTELTVEFDEPYTYEGGNLLIGTYVSVAGNWKSAYFYGVTQTENTGWYRSSGSATGSGAKFLPKTTFTYTPGSSTICTKPTLAVSGITHNEATLTVGGGSGTYNVQYKAASATDWTDVATNTTETTFTLSGLTPLTAYEAQVQSVCDGGATSDWRPASFSTTAQAEAVGDAWSDDFEGNACGWELVNGTCTNAWVWGTAANNGGTHALYISNDNGTSNAYTVNSAAMVYATKLLNFTEGKFEFSFDWIANGESTWDFLRVALVPASVTLTAGTTLPSGLSTTAVPTGWIAVDGGSKLNLVTAWQNTTVAVNVPAGNYYLVLAWRDDTSGGAQPPAAVDNVSITRITCEYEVTDLDVGRIETTYALCTWNGGGAEQWQVVYADNAGFENATEEIWNSNHYTFQNLQPATTYYVKVRAYCGGEDFGAWSNTVDFTTKCEAFTDYPYTENFDDITVPSTYTPSTRTLPICWNAINTCTNSTYTNYPTIYYYSYTNYANSTPNCLRFYSAYSSYSNYDPQDQYAILPLMENLAGKQITLQVRGYNASSTFKVGLMTDPADATTFTEIATQDGLTTSYQEFTYTIPANATANYVAIMIEAANSSRTYNGVYIDDISINFPPSCPKPTDLALTQNSLTAHTATITWTENGEANQWEVQFGTDANFENYLLETVYDTPTLDFIGLDEATTYYVRVMAQCGPGDESEYSNVINFTTPIACPAPTGLAATDITGHTAQLNWTGNSDSYIVHYRNKVTAEEGLFQGFNTSSVPTGWTTYSGLLGGVLADTIELASSSSYWAFGGVYNGVFDAHTRINIYGTSVRNWLVSPSVEVAANYVFDFDLALTRYSGNLLPVVDTLQQDDKFVVLISTDDMETWTILRQWDNAGSEYVYNNIACSATGEHVSFDLSAYVGQNVRIAFYGESTVSATDSDNNLHIDNVVVGIPIPAGEWMTATSDTTTYTLTGLIPTTDYEVYVESVCAGEISHVTNHITITTDVACPAPTALTVANITPTSAELSWTSIDTDAWEVEVSYNIPAIVTTLTADTNPFTVPDLIPETEYIVRVRANCGDEGYSEWSAPTTFTTLEGCPVPFDVEVDTVITYNSATVAWTGYSESYILNWAYGEINTLLNENFENQTIPADWTNTATADTLVWTVVTDTIHNSYYMVSGNAGVSSSTSEVSCVMTYPAAGFIEFDAECRGEGTSTAWDKCIFSIDNVAQFTYGANVSGWKHYSFPVTAGEHTFTWKYTKDNSVNPAGDYFAVDNIKMYWENLISQEPITTENTSYTFTGLTPESNYYVTVTGVCGDEQTEASEMVEFTTPEQTTLTQTIALSAGTTWVSFYVETSLADLKSALVAALPSGNTTTATIKSQTQNVKYSRGRWSGQLSALDMAQMYTIAVSADCEITLEGMPVDPTTLSVTINPGTNWIAFPYNASMTVTDFFAGFAVNNDVVKSQSQNSKYQRGRWNGQLTTMEPGQGYNYNSASTETRTFTFPAQSK